MADIYVARQQAPGGFDKLVALKFLRDQDDSGNFREMFLDEVRTAALLNHPGIVQTFDAGEIDDRLYMAMEFVNGETLSRFARSVIRRIGEFPVELAAHISRELANALEYAHTLTSIEGEALGLVHRDVSPSNALLSFDGTVKLLDFGIARVATKLHATRAGVIKGKFSYMSPEQASGEAIDHRSDVYSLGIVLWQLLTGKAAFDANSDAELLRKVVAPQLVAPSRAAGGCPAELDDIVMKALRPRATERYASAGQLASALSAFLGHSAPGYDGGKVIRELMTELFADRKDRLARIVKGQETGGLSLEEIDAFGGASIRTPSPRMVFPSVREADVEISVAQGTADGIAPDAPRASRMPVMLGALVAAVGLATAGVVVYRTQWGDRAVSGDRTEPAAAAAAAAATATATATAPAPGTGTASGTGTGTGTGNGNGTASGTGTGTASGTASASGTGTGTASGTASASGTGTASVSGTAPASDEQPSILADDRTAAGASGTETRMPSATRDRTVAMHVPAHRKSPAPSPSRGALVATSPHTAETSPPASGSASPASGSASPSQPPPSVSPPPPVSSAPSAPPDAGVPPSLPQPVAHPIGSLDAIASLSAISVDGPLPDSEIRTTLDRALASFRECYRGAARSAHRTPPLHIKLSFEIDEGRTARNLRVSGDTLGVAGCVKDAAAKLRTRVAPDVGNATVTVTVKFQPIDG
jgi:serine/threonine protein kinase